MIKKNQIDHLSNWIPNFIWSCRILEIKDEKMWDNLNLIILKLIPSFTMDQIYSLVPSIAVLDKGNEEVMNALFSRYYELKNLSDI